MLEHYDCFDPPWVSVRFPNFLTGVPVAKKCECTGDPLVFLSARGSLGKNFQPTELEIASIDHFSGPVKVVLVIISYY